MTAYKFEYIHDRTIHDQGCDKPAFYFKRFPKMGDVIRSDDAQMLNGQTPDPASEIICGSCGLPIGRIFTQCLRRRRFK